MTRTTTGTPDLDEDEGFASFKAAIEKLETKLPGWWISCGLCGLTGHASIGPDYNSKEHGDRLRREYDQDVFDGGFHADLAPGDGWGRVAEAILECIEQVEKVVRARQ